MPNIQIPLVGLTSTQMVACAILCCDEKEYSFANSRDPKISCTRMGTKKHSCVTHTLRKRDDNGRLVSPPADRNPDKVCIPSNKGQDISVKVGGKKKTVTIIPDTLVKIGDDWHAIDAKFPCDNKAINKKLGVPPKTKTKSTKNFKFASNKDAGHTRASNKEDEHYLKYKKDKKKVETSTCMSPQDARDQQAKPKSKGGGFTCDCTKINDL